MPWDDKSGGGGPWGQGPSGGGRGNGAGGPGGQGGQGPDLEEILRRGQERFRQSFPGGSGGGLGARGLLVGLAILVLVWLASGFYRVQPDEQGVVLRFGEYIKTTQPGLNYRMPYPIEAAYTPKVTRVNRVDVGMRTGEDTRSVRQGAVRDVPEESLMLTGDENIIDIDFSVFWVIKDAGDYLFNIQNPVGTVKAVAESSMREVVGESNIQPLLTEGRQAAETKVTDLMQNLLDEYGAGIRITQVQIQGSNPPSAVIDAFRDVQAARADAERSRNEAESYSNRVLPEARGAAERIEQEAAAYRDQTVEEAEGQARRFLSIYGEYAQAPEVTRQRMYLETMERVLNNMNKVLIDSDGGSGVVPYLPLPEVERRRNNATQETN
ncbi:FtsH protease activity modulator HflK [Pyruvatibacter sp.]|uniref:FtsH protease activity modulator HflK n=1 Tax=Pyruvatibacter sp. TaxID=1981328 RepID=UPI0032EBF18F